MKLKIARFDKNKEPQNIQLEYEVENNHTLLDSLIEIKTKQDNTLTYRCGCKSGVCGSCSVRVNGVEKLACKTKVNDGDLIKPLKYYDVIRDLVVDIKKEEKLLNSSKAYLEEKSNNVVTSEDEKKIDRQSNCILCQSCYSSCPVFEVNKEFLGPYALTRVLRYIDDKKELKIENKLNSIQDNGIWDCTLCGNCTMVCPQFIDPKTDIMNLRMKSVQNGFKDKSIQDFSGGFDAGFNPSGGFNPNGF